MNGRQLVDEARNRFSQAALAAKLRDIIDSARAPGRVLLVEDEALVQMMATDYLERAGFKLDSAGSATEAMNKLALVPGGVDAVIIDIGLPDRRGDDLAREILAMYSSLPILLAIGQDLADLRLAFQGKKVAFVSKPYTEADLLGSLCVFGLGPTSR